MSPRLLFAGAGLVFFAAGLPAAPVVENVAPRALAIPSVLANPINGGKPIVFRRGPEFADGRDQTGYRLVGDQPGRLEFFFDPARPETPGRCEVLTQMEKVLAGHVEILRGGRWVRVSSLKPGDWMVTADWAPEPTTGVAVTIENTTDLDHEPVRVMEVRLLAEVAAPISGQSFAGTLALTTARPFNVFTLGDEIVVDCRVAGNQPVAGISTVHWRWDNFVNATVDTGGEEKLTPGAPVACRLRPREQGPLLLHAWLTDDRTGTTLAASVILVGVRDPGFPGTVPPLRAVTPLPLPHREEVTHRMLFGAELYHRMLPAQFKAGAAPFAAFQQGGLNLVAAYQDVAWFEPLPGVFNFAGLDSVVAGAEAHGLGVELGLWRWYYGSPGLDGPTNLQYWLEPYAALRRDGTKGRQWLNAPSLGSDDFRKSALRAAEVFLRRYREHSSVWIWHLHPFGIVDHDFVSTSGEREAPLDYSPHARKAYADFLAGKYSDIAALNDHYGSAYAVFDDVPLPAPLVKDMADFHEAITTFDNRPAWTDYLEFRDRAMVHGFEREIYSLVRKFDPERPIGGMSNTMANAESAAEVALRAEFGAYYGDQNTETPAFVRRYLGTGAGLLPFRGEDHSPINPRRFTGDYRVRMNEFLFNCAAVGVNELNYVFPVWEENPAWAMFTSPGLQEAFRVNAASRVLPAEVGVLHSFASGAQEGFTSYAFIELHRWLDLLGWSQTMTHPGTWAEPVSVDGAPGNFPGKRLLIDNDSRLLAPAAVTALRQFVEAGGDLMLQRTSGQFEPGQAAPTWPLLRALGFENLDALTRPFAAETKVAIEEGPLAGLTLPLRDLAEIKQPGAVPVATAQGRIVAAFWKRGRGRVLLLGGTIGDYSLAEERRRQLENRGGGGASLAEKQRERAGLYEQLMIRLQAWSGLGPQGLLSESPVEVMARKTRDGYSIALRNPGPVVLAKVALRIPHYEGGARQAVAAYAEKSEHIPVTRAGSDAVLELQDVAPGAFCLISF